MHAKPVGCGLAIALLALAGCALGARPWPASDRDEAVALRFGWPLGLSSRVSFERERVHETRERSEGSHWTGSYRLTVLTARGGRLIRYDDFEISDFTSSGRADGASSAALRDASTRVSVLMPSLVVGDDGEVMRVEGMDRLRKEVDRLARVLDPRLAGNPRARALLDELVSEERLAQTASEEWNALVGSWAEIELEPGVVYEAEDSAVLPFFGGLVIPTLHEVSLLQELPCPTASRRRRCVELEMRSLPSPEAMPGVMAQLHETADSVPEAPRLEALEFETRIHLITEPETLIPHSLETSREVRATVHREDGEREPIESRERHVYRFRYAD